MNFCITISEINWSLTKDVFSIIGTIGALTIASLGLFTWKRQLRGTSEYELAKKAILKVYEVEQAIQSVRNPMLRLNREEVEAGHHLDEEQKIYGERMEHLYSKWTELQVIRLETKVVWSMEAHASFEPVQTLIGELRSGIWLHFWLKGAYAGPGIAIDNNPDRAVENGKVVYFTSDTDEFSLKVKAAVENVENFFSSRVRSK